MSQLVKSAQLSQRRSSVLGCRSSTSAPFSFSTTTPEINTERLPLQTRILRNEPCSPRGIDLMCHAFDPKKPSNATTSTDILGKINQAYVVIFGVFAGLFLFRNPYIFAGLSILTILPQNSNVTSLNTLVLWFYESGLFTNFAEAVYCVRLVTWLSIASCLLSFAIFS